MDRGQRAGSRRLDRSVEALIVGAGPAGLAAAASLARYGRRVLVLDSRPAGGQARGLPVVENYPGFPSGVGGARLMSRFADQARRWGARLEARDVLRLRRTGGGFSAETLEGAVSARAVVLATGCGFKPLGLPREWSLRGVLHGGVGELRGLRGRVCVVGGGEAAAYQAIAASAASRSVTLAVRGKRLAAHGLLKRRLVEAGVRVLTRARPLRLLGRSRLSGVEFRLPKGARRISADRLLVLTGKRPRRLLGKACRGPGLFWAGDVRLGRFRQVALASADGVRAAMSCERYLDENR
ncbi:MAG: NAD(P)/FAD-dependent oxidoreductase [Elusimicrobia bacterium]|nr:NAD(P)/FAD-dependent oxidoreductase [Elusimicrobiota bacterium]